MRVVYDANKRHSYQPFPNDICETVQAAYGTGGGNIPLVVESFDGGDSDGYDSCVQNTEREPPLSDTTTD